MIVMLSMSIVISMLNSDVGSTVYADLEQECIARTVYMEARGEPLKGKIAVAYTVINRAKKRHLGVSEWCQTVKFKKQYQWAKDYENLEPMSEKDMLIAYQVTYSILYNKQPDISKGALYFYNPSISVSSFHEKQEYLFTIGNHRFFK